MLELGEKREKGARLPHIPLKASSQAISPPTVFNFKLKPLLAVQIVELLYHFHCQKALRLSLVVSGNTIRVFSGYFQNSKMPPKN